ncbi:MAG TPA: chorismate synthase [Candidatus Elarobacter sp.]|nr:chorismate synthase [Candidatus Elarobacter sp.]
MSLRFLTAGESHGAALVGIIEGIPSGLALDAATLLAQARRRKLGYGRGNRQNIETDEVRIVAGVRRGVTIGSPVALVLDNRDHVRWAEIMRVDAPGDGAPAARQVHVPRPGHADRIGGIKYDRDDLRDVLERASARETAMRVALGTVARALLGELGVTLASRVVRIGAAVDDTPWRDVTPDETDASPVRALDPAATAAMVAEIDRAKAEGDSLGGVFEVVARNVPVALGSYAQWDRRLEGEVAKTFMALNAIKGVEIGLGFGAAAIRGSRAHDEYEPGDGARTRYRSNRAGGIEGGMSTGQPIVVRAAMKPIATLMQPLDSVDLRSGDASAAHIERSDTCAVPAAAVIGESLLALALAAAVMDKFGGDSLGELRGRVRSWESTVRAR